MKRTVGIVVGVLLVVGVIGFSMWRDLDAVEHHDDGGPGPIAILREVEGKNAPDAGLSARANPSSTTTPDAPTPTPVPSPSSSTPDAQATSANGARGLVMDADEESRSRAPVLGTLDKGAIQDAIRAVKPQIAACYEKALAHDPDLSGRLVVEFTIEGVDGGGSVTAGEINTSDMQAPFFEACVLKEVAHTPFPLPEGGGMVKVKYPFSFDQGEGHAD